MATTAELEIYRQRYETYRHLDRLRWQMLPVAAGAGAAILAFARYRSEPVWWVFLGVGLLLIISGVAMLRIGQGINRNGEVLRKIAATIGDKDIPPVGKRLKSVAFWISWTMIGLGVISLLAAIFTFTTTDRRYYLPIHKVFISYYHDDDQDYKEELVEMGENNEIFIDRSVDTGDIPDNLPSETIRRKIRDDYLRDSTVTIVLVGRNTWRRKHVDWEIHSSMFDGPINKQSGILVVNLPPAAAGDFCTAAHPSEKERIYRHISNWTTIDNEAEYRRRYPYMPARIIDNLLKPEALVSVTPWSTIADNPSILKFLVDAAFQDRKSCEYDLSRPMRRQNSSR